jgi:phosphate transport system substrate-binding protein
MSPVETTAAVSAAAVVQPTSTAPLATATADVEATAAETKGRETPEAEPSPTAEPTLTPTPLSGQIRAVGSTTMQPVIEALAIAFSAQSPNIQIVIQDGGSQAGLEAVRQGVADAGLVSRELTVEELTGLQLFNLAQTDPIVLIVHPIVQLDSLSTGQVRDIFSGAITNWAEVGGAEAPIQVVSRAEGSGTRATFEQIIMGQPGLITASTSQEETNQAVRNMVAGRPFAIGFVSRQAALADPTLPPGSPNWAVIDNALLGVKLLALDGVAPTLDNARNNSYPLTRPLNIVVADPPSPLVQEWLNFIASPTGRQIIEGAGHLNGE